MVRIFIKGSKISFNKHFFIGYELYFFSNNVEDIFIKYAENSLNKKKNELNLYENKYISIPKYLFVRNIKRV